jgi:hypothetical protein
MIEVTIVVNFPLQTHYLLYQYDELFSLLEEQSTGMLPFGNIRP